VRITYFADIRFPLERANGIQTMETCHALVMRGHDVDLIVRPDTHTPARDPFEYYGLAPTSRLRITQAPVSGPPAARRLGYMAFASGRAAGRARADVLLTRDLGVASLLLTLPRTLRPPLVYESHGYAPEVAAALPGLVSTASPPHARKLLRLARREARVWRLADGYVTITAALAADLAARHGPRESVAPSGGSGIPTDGSSRLAVIPDGARIPLEPDESRDEFGPASEAVVAYAGHLYAWKGVDILLDALALVPAAHGLIIGGHAAEPDLGRLKALAVRLGIADRVTFTGMVAPAHVPALLRRARVLALPNPASAISSRFTSPLKLFEYMAAGRAIVASDLPSIREILHSGVDALLVTPGSAEALAAAIRVLLADPELAARLARAALHAAPDYSWDRRAERLETLLADVQAMARSSSR
jgi:glycosyltransferase involved in cell wall biosynthesis